LHFSLLVDTLPRCRDGLNDRPGLTDYDLLLSDADQFHNVNHADGTTALDRPDLLRTPRMNSVVAQHDRQIDHEPFRGREETGELAAGASLKVLDHAVIADGADRPQTLPLSQQRGQFQAPVAVFVSDVGVEIDQGLTT
jgi:hypothetical protein